MTRLYSAYARDMLSFLNFAQLQECRLVSHSVNATIVSQPYSISARRHLSQVNFLVARAEDFNSLRIDETTGYVDTTKKLNFDWIDYTPWKTVQAGWGCCREELKVGGFVEQSMRS